MIENRNVLADCIEKIADIKFVLKKSKDYMELLDKILDLLNNCLPAKNVKDTLLETKIYLKLMLIEEIIENDESEKLVKISEVLNEIVALSEKRNTQFL